MEPEEYMQYQETRRHGQPGFPYNTYLCTIPLDFPRVGLHWHEQMEIIYVKKGSGVITVNLRAYPVSVGCIMPVLPGELHTIEGAAEGAMEYENIIFSLSILDSAEADDWCRKHVVNALRQGNLSFERPIRPGTDFHRAASAALDTADLACEAQEPGYLLVVKSQLFLFLHALYRFQSPGTAPAQTENTEKLKDLLSYVKAHYREPITIAEAAAITGYSPSHFMRIFRQETGQTFVEYLTDYRLSAAVYYLNETEDAISAVAERCGFDSISYFIRQFRKKYGVSPGKYRSGTGIK